LRLIVAGSAFAAGTDSSVVTLLWFVMIPLECCDNFTFVPRFIMAVALHPWTMEKAQQEIDSVFDSNTLPNFSRMRDLPYCFALVKEVLRFAFSPLRASHQID
jgi:hypothetical protein